MEFQLLASTENFRSKTVAIFWKLSKIGDFIAKYYVRTATFIRVSLCHINKRVKNIIMSFFFVFSWTIRKYKEKHRFIGVFEGRQPKLLVLDPELVNDIYVKLFNHFQVNDSSDSVSFFVKKKSDSSCSN